MTHSKSGELFLRPPSIGLSTSLLNQDHHAAYYADTPQGPRGELLRRHGDSLLAALLALMYVVELLRYPNAQLEITIPLAVAACVVLGLRRRAPLLVFLVVSWFTRADAPAQLDADVRLVMEV